MSSLAEYLSTGRIVLPMHATDRTAAIRELIRALEADQRINVLNEDQCIESILRRERRYTTGIGKGVALPHGVSDSVQDVVVAMGISVEGIDFKAVDDMLCHIFILFISPSSNPEKHLKLLSRFAKLLGNGELRSTLMEADTPARVLAILHSWENRENSPPVT